MTTVLFSPALQLSFTLNIIVRCGHERMIQALATFASAGLPSQSSSPGLLALRCGPRSLRPGSTIWIACGDDAAKTRWVNDWPTPAQLLATTANRDEGTFDELARTYIASCRRLEELGGSLIGWTCTGWLRSGDAVGDSWLPDEDENDEEEEGRGGSFFAVFGDSLFEYDSEPSTTGGGQLRNV